MLAICCGEAGHNAFEMLKNFCLPNETLDRENCMEINTNGVVRLATFKYVRC